MIVKTSPDLPRSCVDHVSNGYSEDDIYTIFTDTTSTMSMRDIYCYMSAAPWTVCSPVWPLNRHTKTVEQGPSYGNTVIGTLAVDGRAVTFGTARRPLLAVPNVTAHPATTSVPTLYYSMYHCNCLWGLKGYYIPCGNCGILSLLLYICFRVGLAVTRWSRSTWLRYAEPG